MKIEIIDNGPRVVCDVCGSDYSESNESGGFLFGSYAYCPKCAVTHIAKIREYGEERFVKNRCPEGKSFKDWVLIDLRQGDNNTVIINL